MAEYGREGCVELSSHCAQSLDDILDELDILLTSGRLTDKNRELIKSHVSLVFDTGDVAKAVRVAQELIFASPEFHSTTDLNFKSR